MATRGVIDRKTHRRLARWLFNRTHSRAMGHCLWSQLGAHVQGLYLDVARDILITGLDAESLMEHL